MYYKRGSEGETILQSTRTNVLHFDFLKQRTTNKLQNICGHRSNYCTHVPYLYTQIDRCTYVTPCTCNVAVEVEEVLCTGIPDV